MWRDITVAAIVLLVTSGLGLATNYLREKPLPLIRQAVLPADDPEANPTGQIAATAQEPASDAMQGGSAEDSGQSPPPRKGIALIDEVLHHLALGTAYFIDAREAHEYAEGHLRGALNLPSSAIYQNIDSIVGLVPPDGRVIVYCGGGQCEASHNVTDALRRDFGFTNVVIYEKGWEEVSQSGKFGDYIVGGDQP